ncbi:MAG: hypothetical protein ABIS14_12520 [Sphingomonas sp.]
MAVFRQAPPVWFWIVAIVFALWGAMGVYAFYADVTMSEAARAQLSAYDRNLLASRPAWFVWLYGISVWSGLIGSAVLLLRSAQARWLFVVELVTVIAMFGYIFAVTDLIAVKGFGPAAGFPIFIFAVCVVQIWFVGMTRRRGWIG